MPGSYDFRDQLEAHDRKWGGWYRWFHRLYWKFALLFRWPR